MCAAKQWDKFKRKRGNGEGDMLLSKPRLQPVVYQKYECTAGH